MKDGDEFISVLENIFGIGNFLVSFPFLDTFMIDFISKENIIFTRIQIHVLT